MTDLQPLINLSAHVALDPSEDNLETFLQAYNNTEPPKEQVEFLLFEALGDITITEYFDPPCQCSHNHEEEANA
jgi:hypothetical protein